MEMSKVSANAGATVASMTLCLPTAGVGVGASTGNPTGVVGEASTILGPRIDINTHHNGVTGNNACLGSTQNRGGHFNDDVYHSHHQHSSFEVNQPLSANNHLNDVGDNLLHIYNSHPRHQSVHNVKSFCLLRTYGIGNKQANGCNDPL